VMLMAKDLFGFEIEPVVERLRARRNEAQRWFDEHINDETDECIIWPFAIANGYGHLSGRKVSAWACEIKHGTKPGPKYEARHGPCNNRACMNYHHLSWGTSQQNKFDQIRDGTRRVGVQRPSAKLIEKEIVEIHDLHSHGFSDGYIARQYDVHRTTITDIINGKTWKHVKIRT
jgi:hypothetical protein